MAGALEVLILWKAMQVPFADRTRKCATTASGGHAHALPALRSPLELAAIDGPFSLAAPSLKMLAAHNNVTALQACLLGAPFLSA